MALPPLAELSDVEDRLGRDLDATESRRAAALLADASTVVRNYTARDFTAGTTTARYRPRGRKVILPKRPVVAVRAVKAVQSFGTTQMVTPLGYWSWPGGHEVVIGDPSLIINGPTYDLDDSGVWIEVTYDHGFPEVPEDVKAVVANLVVRNMLTPVGGVVDSETVGPYNVRYSGSTMMGPLGLGEPDRTILNRYRSTTTNTVELRG